MNLAFLVTLVMGGIVALRHSTLPLPYPCMLPVAAIAPADLPKPVGLTGPFTPNTRLRAATRLFDGLIAGSESVAVAPNGTLVMCDRAGFVWHAEVEEQKKGSAPVFSTPRRIAHLGPGRPLGFHHDKAGNLLVCMAGGAGLVRLDARSGRVEVLASLAHEEVEVYEDGSKPRMSRLSPILYANDLDIDAADGSVYFTDSAAIQPVLNAEGFADTLRAYMLSLFQGGKTGRLLRWDATSGVAVVVASGLSYANGVALLPPPTPGAPATHAAVVETNAMRVVKVGLRGAGTGTVEPFLQPAGLPGFPDGLSRGASKTSGGGEPVLWLALVAPPSPLARYLAPRLLRFLAAWAPRPPLGKWGAVVKVSATDGRVLDALFDLGGQRVASTSAVTDVGKGRLYLGNLNGAYVSVVDVETAGSGGEDGEQRDEL